MWENEYKHKALPTRKTCTHEQDAEMERLRSERIDSVQETRIYGRAIQHQNRESVIYRFSNALSAESQDYILAEIIKSLEEERKRLLLAPADVGNNAEGREGGGDETVTAEAPIVESSINQIDSDEEADVGYVSFAESMADGALEETTANASYNASNVESGESKSSSDDEENSSVGKDGDDERSDVSTSPSTTIISNPPAVLRRSTRSSRN